MREFVAWLATLDTTLKVLASLVVVIVAAFLLISMWRPVPPHDDASAGPPAEGAKAADAARPTELLSSAPSPTPNNIRGQTREGRPQRSTETVNATKETPRTMNEQRTSGSASPIVSGNNNTVTINQSPQMQPMVEGFTASARQVPSPRPDAPFAIELVVQVQAPVSPVSLGIYVDRPLVEGKMLSPSISFNHVEGTMNDDPERSFLVGFASPAITPTQPLVVRLIAREPFSVSRIVKTQP